MLNEKIITEYHLPANYALGTPLPPSSKHAVSVSMPLWQNIIDYEEGSAELHSSLKAGYPRFVKSKQVLSLAAAVENNGDCEAWIYSSVEACKRAISFIGVYAPNVPKLVYDDRLQIHFVSIPRSDDAASLAAKAYWQHTGEICSSRRAAAVLNRRLGVTEETDATASIKHSIAELIGSHPKNVFLFESGMTAIYAGLMGMLSLRPGLPTLQLGFPYVDTLKLQQLFAPGLNFVARPHKLGGCNLPKPNELAGIMCEIPSNPLLQTPNLAEWNDYRDSVKLPLLVDDTLGGFLDLNILPKADMVATSLTKYFTGSCNVMGGSLVLNDSGANYAQLQAFLSTANIGALWPEDACIINDASQGYKERMRSITQNASILADYLNSHPAVAKVYFPALNNCRENYALLQKAGSANRWGGLLSFELKDPSTAPHVYDSLKCAKGPSLGTEFTLVCPYTLLAHYKELDFAANCGVSSNLLRTSVGVEPIEEILATFAEALNSA